MRDEGFLAEWSEQSGLSIAELANLCNVPEPEIIRVKTGEQGLIGELQDYLTRM